jgi:alpha-galactosidase
MSGHLKRLFTTVCGLCFLTVLNARATEGMAPTPPMGWNDWAHYQCHFTAQTIVENAQALVKTGLAARGYDTVTIDDCWMTKDRDAQGNLQADPQRFPQGMRPVADAVHALGLKFGIYEDAGYTTCGKFAGSGMPHGGGKDHFLADARLFASWGVDYLKLDGCNLFVPKGQSENQAYEVAYRAQRDALRQVDRPIVFSESAPAYFQGKPQWYDVLTWVRGYGQLWREGDDIGNYDAKDPNHPRFDSVLWNYSYHLPIGRFQTPNNWNDADFIIGGDAGMSAAETRSQLALWSMMASPLILSSDVARLSPESLKILGNKDVIAVDQDTLGRQATLLRRGAGMDVLIKPLSSSAAYAVAVFNHGDTPAAVDLRPADLGFYGTPCDMKAQDLWTGEVASASAHLSARVASHDTAIWKITPGAGCGTAVRQGAITRIIPDGPDATHNPEDYTRCLSTAGTADKCAGTSSESWQALPDGRLRSGNQCLSASGSQVLMSACAKAAPEYWHYDLLGRLINRATHQCLTAAAGPVADNKLSVAACEHNPASQIWSIPEPMASVARERR